MKEFFKDLRDPKFWASVCAWMVPISIAVLWGVGIKYCWTRSEIGTFIAAIAGPLAGLAGFLYIYVNFIEQQEQFERQSFESNLNRLIDKYLEISRSTLPLDPNDGLHPLLRKFKIRYLAAFDSEKIITSIATENENSIPKSDKPNPEGVGEIYYSIFKPSFRMNEGLMTNFLPILIFLNNSSLTNKENYFTYLHSQLKKDEYRVLFYGIFCKEFNLLTDQKDLLKAFFNRFNSSMLLLNTDLELIS